VGNRRSRSRTPHSRSGERAGQHSGERRSHANRTESYLSEDEEDFKQLMEVTEETHRLLTDSCTWGMSIETRKCTRNHFKLPKSAQSADKELARLQTFILDALAPLTAILEGAKEMTVQDIKEALMTASILI
uniref:Uncharacterized protein n=1 Tax=Amphimedon queenslandica TaxID=400682 RepID=A0A1X7UW63_AMPQE